VIVILSSKSLAKLPFVIKIHKRIRNSFHENNEKIQIDMHFGEKPAFFSLF